MIRAILKFFDDLVETQAQRMKPPPKPAKEPPMTDHEWRRYIHSLAPKPNRKSCMRTGCSEMAEIFSNYCAEHGPSRTMNMGPGAVGPLTLRQRDEVRRIVREEIAEALPPRRLPAPPPDSDGIIKVGF